MIRISPYTPLFFSPSSDESGLRGDFIQTFAKTDNILIEMITDVGDAEPEVLVENKVTGSLFGAVLTKWQMNETMVLYYCTLNLLPNGCYTVKIGGKESELFRVTDNLEDLKYTTLLQYSNKDNRKTDDAVFFIDNAQVFFDFRVTGGFKDNGWSFSVDTEQFVTPQSDIISLYAQPSTQKRLTVGGQQGCPIWFGEQLNYLFCCDYVYINGERYCRKESSIPEPTEVAEGFSSFVFTQLVQKVNHLDPVIENANKLAYRRANEHLRTADMDKETRMRIL